jgi:hypothetical protein
MKIILVILLFLTAICHCAWQVAADEGLYHKQFSAGAYVGYQYGHIVGEVGYNSKPSYVFISAGYDIRLNQLHLTPLVDFGHIHYDKGEQGYTWIAGARLRYKPLFAQVLSTCRLSAGLIVTL